MPNDPTLIDLIIKSLKSKVKFDSENETAPIAILWLDGDREWETVLPLLRSYLPHILTLGDYSKENRTGPAIWIRAMLARALEDHIAKDTVPILYLPGFSINDISDSNTRSKSLDFFIDIKYRGVLWCQSDNQPWSVIDFCSNAQEGSGIQLIDTEYTRKAMLRVLPQFCKLPLSHLKAEQPWKVKDFEALGDMGIEQLIQQGENAVLEFKSTCRWDMKDHCKKVSLEQEIQKAVAGFLNSEKGGTLLIGVEDNGNVCGIDLDLQTFENEAFQNNDYYFQYLMAFLSSAFGKEFSACIHPTFHSLNGRTICQVVVDPAPEPIVIPYLFPKHDKEEAPKKNKEDTFFLRVGNATNPLKLREAIKYVKLHWVKMK